MTRINCGIPPRELNNKHLFSEYREMKRIPNMLIKGKYSLKDIPENFTLGKGHVKFFYNKLLYLKNRNEELKNECLLRGINITDYSETYNIAISLFPNLSNDYIPSDRDREIIRKRISERIEKSIIKKYE